MNKYTKSLLITTISLFSINSFAVTEQISFAQNFLGLDENKIILENIEKLGFNSLKGEFDEKIFFSQIKNNHDYFAISPTRDLQLESKHKSNLLLEYQKNNNLESTGFMNEETISFINHKQDEFGLNITKFLDPNTWFVSYNQPLPWRVKTVRDSLIEWNSIFEKQKAAGTHKFVIVNVPNMRITGYSWNPETNTATEEFVSRVVVGSRSHKTPMDDMKIWGLKYNPTWTPTPNIMKRTLFKDGELNLKWLNGNKIKVIDPNGNTIDYSQLTEDNYKQMRFIQPAGNDNALGLIKFETNSKDNIYLHDTNDKKLFSHNSRAYSSGCIRVEEFVDFSMWLTEKDLNYIADKVNSGETRTFNTPARVPVYTTHTQAYFDDHIPAFAPDVYRKTKTVIYKKP